MGASTVEVLDSVRGKVLDGSTSRLSKSAIFKIYTRVCGNVVGMEIPATYRAAKMNAEGYHAAKRALYSHVASVGYGKWMQKPEEQEEFT